MYGKVNTAKEFLFTLFISLGVFAIFSTVFDEVFFKIDRGDAPGNGIESFFHYLVYGMTIGLIGWIIISTLYTVFYVRFRIVTSPRIWRMVYAIGFGLLMGFLLQHSEGSYYIGDMRPQRNMMLYPSISFTVEALRLWFLRNPANEKTT